jgi:hypothetical protein
MGGNQGIILEITISSDMIKMLVGIDNDIDILDLDTERKKGPLQFRKISI